jgi:NAD+ kinase
MEGRPGAPHRRDRRGDLDADKRPLAATADFHELFHVVSVTICEDTSTTVQLLFDADHSLEERIIAEQFLT